MGVFVFYVETIFSTQLHQCAEEDVNPFTLVTGFDVNINGVVCMLS